VGAQLRIVRRRIRSVQSTKKITRAMELIASSRIVKAQQRVESSRPYAIQLTKAMEDLARQTGSVQHPPRDCSSPSLLCASHQKINQYPIPRAKLSSASPIQQQRSFRRVALNSR